MVNLLTDIGEEWYTENNLDGASVTVGLYSDSTDALTDTSTLSDISQDGTSEPQGTSYAAQSTTVTTLQISGNFGFDNDSTLTFDTSDSSATVDAAYIQVNFQSDTVAGDTSTADHLVAAGDLSQSRDLSQIDTLEIAAGDLEITVD